MDVIKLLKEAERLGASEAEIYRVVGKEVTVKTSDKVISASSKTSDSVGVRVAVGKKVSVVGTEDVGEASLLRAVESAVKIAKVMPEDEFWVGMNDVVKATPLQGILDRFTAKATPLDLKDVAEEALNAVLEGSSKSRPVRGSFTAGYSAVEVINSYGGPVRFEGSYAAMYLNVKAFNAGREGTFSDFSYSRSLKSLKAAEVGRRAGEEAARFIDAGKVETGVYEVILDSSVSASLLSALLSPALSALNVQEGRSPLKGRLGEAVLSESITVKDVGLAPELLSSRPFDAEGHPVTDRVLLNAGVLKDYAYDAYTAKKEGRESTGNAWRVYSSAPRPRPNHLYLLPGEESLSDMISSTRKGIYVVRTIGDWLSNPVSGELNATVTHGFLIIDGEVKMPCRGCVISGNFYELFRSHVASVGREVRHLPNSSAPHIKLEKVKVAG